jgi:hypothetical protein
MSDRGEKKDIYDHVNYALIKRSERTQNSNYEVEILGIEEIDPKNLSVSKDLKTYNQKIGVSKDISMGLSLLLCQADLKIFRYETDVNQLYKQ